MILPWHGAVGNMSVNTSAAGRCTSILLPMPTTCPTPSALRHLRFIPPSLLSCSLDLSIKPLPSRLLCLTAYAFLFDPFDPHISPTVSFPVYNMSGTEDLLDLCCTASLVCVFFYFIFLLTLCFWPGHACRDAHRGLHSCCPWPALPPRGHNSVKKATTQTQPP